MHQRRDLLLETLLEPVFIASNYLADDKRPLAEMNATHRVKKDVSFELRRCPYSGSRFEKEMNVSALASLAPQIKTVISDTITLRNAYLQHIGESDFTLLSFWRFSRILDSLPVFMVRKKLPVVAQDNVPARVSAMFKAAQGLHLAPEVLLSGMDIHARVEVDQLLDIIEGRDLYLMDETRACAGPPAMIRAFVESAVEGTGKHLDDSWLVEFLKQNGFDGLFAYSDAATSVFAHKILYEARCRLETQQVLADLNDDELTLLAQSMLSRFGSLQGLDVAMLTKVAEHFTYICGQEAVVAANDFSHPKRFEKMLLLRNPRVNPHTIRVLAIDLMRYLLQEREWFAIFRQQQTHVLDALGYKQKAPALSSDDFSGYGYHLRDLLSHWLKVEIHNLESDIVVRAGASDVRFELDELKPRVNPAVMS